MAILESTSTGAKNIRKENSVARIVGSGSAGILELALFHPVNSPQKGTRITDMAQVDTIAKRLMSNHGKVGSILWWFVMMCR